MKKSALLEMLLTQELEIKKLQDRIIRLETANINHQMTLENTLPKEWIITTTHDQLRKEAKQMVNNMGITIHRGASNQYVDEV